MDAARYNPARMCRLMIVPLAILTACGCQTIRTPEEHLAKMNNPKELDMISLPEYVVEPPDILLVEVLEALPGRPIQGERLVRPDGTISLGFYGDVYVAGLTCKEIKEKIVIHLRKWVNDDVLGLVGQDLEKKDDEGRPLRFEIPPAESDTVVVDVASYNSHVYYVLGDTNFTGRFPITGNERVLDAIQYAGGIAPDAATNNIRLVRPAPPGACCTQILPVNIAAIMQAGDTTTNYQILPGDRIFVYRDPIVRTTIFLNRLAQPFNTVLNSMLQYSFAARSIKSVNVPINGVTNGTTTGTTGTATGGAANNLGAGAR